MADIFLSSFKRNITIIYILHFILDIILVTININYHISKYWINISFKIIFLIGIIIVCFFSLFPLIPLYFIYFHQNLKKKFYNNILKISLLFLITNILIGIILNIIFWINLSKFPSFYKDCPYNYALSDLDKINGNNDDYKSNEICQKRLCLLYDYNFLKDNYIILKFDNSAHLFNLEENKKNYLCNFDSSQDFENNEVICIKTGVNSKNDYFSFCNKYIFYYICQRNNDHLKYNININNGCPQEKSDSILSNIGDIFIILNIIFGCVPWSFELFFIKKYLNKNESNESEDQNENNNHIIINIEQSRNLNQIRNIFNRTTNSSDINIQRPNSNEIVNINEEINETINNNNIIKNTNSNESIKYIFVGKETTKNAIYNDSEEDEKEKEKIKIKNNRDYKLNINLIKSPHKDTETNNFETNNNNKNPTSMKEIVLLNKKNNLFSLKKNINDNDNDLIFIQKHKRFINSNNKTLNVIQTHFNIVLNKKKIFHTI